MHRNKNSSVFLEEKVTYIFRLFGFLTYFFFYFFRLSFFSISYLFAALIDLLLSLLPVKTFLKQHHQDGQLLPWCSCRKFCSEFSPKFLDIFVRNFYFMLHWAHHPDVGIIGRSFLLQNLSIDDANFAQRWWHQKQNKGQCSSQLVSDDTGINGLKTGSLDNVLSEAFMIYMYSLYEQLHVNHVLNKYGFSVSANKCKVLRTWCTAHVNWETGHVKIIKLSIYMDTCGGFITDSMCTKFCLKDTHEGLEFPQQATDFILLKCTDWNWTKTCPNTSTFLIGPLSPRFISL